MPEEVILPRRPQRKHRRKGKTKVRAHQKKRGWWHKHLRRFPEVSTSPAREVILPVDPQHPEPSRKGVIATYSLPFVQQHPEILEGITAPAGFIQLDVTQNWFRFRQIEPEEFIPRTYRTKILSPEVHELRARLKTTGKEEVQSIMVRRPNLLQVETNK